MSFLPFFYLYFLSLEMGFGLIVRVRFFCPFFFFSFLFLCTEILEIFVFLKLGFIGNWVKKKKKKGKLLYFWVLNDFFGLWVKK